MASLETIHEIKEEEELNNGLYDIERNCNAVENGFSQPLTSIARLGCNISSDLRYSPLAWDAFYDEYKDIHLPDFPEQDVFRIYLAGCNNYKNSDINNNHELITSNTIVILLLHGGGHSSLSWAPVAKRLKKKHCVIAIDFRGHGKSIIQNEQEMSANRLTADIVSFIRYCLPSNPIILAGHSLGGAIAVRVANDINLTNIKGLVVLDVVEDTALAALSYMRRIISNRGKTFRSLEDAIRTIHRIGEVQNLQSLRVSVPGQLSFDQMHNQYVWRTDLMAQEPFWRGWFEGLDDLFLSAPAAKMLMLANADRLDTKLTIAQMQGKYQLFLVSYGVGHHLNQDAFVKISEGLATFCVRNRFGQS